MTSRREVQLPKLRMEAHLEPATLDMDKRTVSLRWYAGATVQRFSFMEGEYMLTFAMNPKNVRLGRMNNGAPLKAGHTGYSDLESVIGVIDKAWIKDGEGFATARFSARDNVKPILQDLQDGIFKNVSMEAAIFAMEDVTEKGAPVRHFLATDWEPMAVALVQVGADPDAQALEHGETFLCSITERVNGDALKETRMSEQNDTTTVVEQPGVPAPKLDIKALDAKAEDRAVEDAIEADKQRAARIRHLAKHHNLDEVWAQRHIKLNTSIEQVIADATEARTKLAPKIDGTITMGEDYDSARARFEMMTSAIVSRAKSETVPESARQYARASLVSMALERVALRNHVHGLDPRFDQQRIIELALTSSDFPNLLANSASKLLMADYEHAPVTYRKLAARQDLPDFKTASVLKVGDFPVPLQVGESGEIKLGAFSESKDSYALASYGRRLMFSFQSIVNDDLGAFGRVMGGYGARLADFENSLWFASLISAAGAGPTLGDTGALFNATAVTTAGGHANLTSSGTAIDVTSLGIARAMMKKQASLDGLKLNIRPRYLLTSPDKETIAEQYTTQITPAIGSSVNPFSGKLETLADANLVSANPWYLFADPMVAPVSVYGYLAGQTGPDVASRPGFEVLGVELRVALHFGFAFVDFRGAYRNAGA